MPQSTNRSLDRLGAASGLGAIALLVVSAVTGEMPSPDTPVASIARSKPEPNHPDLLVRALRGLLPAGLRRRSRCDAATGRRP